MRQEIMEVVSRYVELEPERMEFFLKIINGQQR